MATQKVAIEIDLYNLLKDEFFCRIAGSASGEFILNFLKKREVVPAPEELETTLVRLLTEDYIKIAFESKRGLEDFQLRLALRKTPNS